MPEHLFTLHFIFTHFKCSHHCAPRYFSCVRCVMFFNGYRCHHHCMHTNHVHTGVRTTLLLIRNTGRSNARTWPFNAAVCAHHNGRLSVPHHLDFHRVHYRAHVSKSLHRVSNFVGDHIGTDVVCVRCDAKKLEQINYFCYIPSIDYSFQGFRACDSMRTGPCESALRHKRCIDTEGQKPGRTSLETG